MIWVKFSDTTYLYYKDEQEYFSQIPDRENYEIVDRPPAEWLDTRIINLIENLNKYEYMISIIMKHLDVYKSVRDSI